MAHVDVPAADLIAHVRELQADSDAMRLIHAELLKPQFSTDALEAIREIVRATGRITDRFPREA